MEKKVRFEELKKAYKISAMLVTLHGDIYLPIFERLEKEYNDRLKKKEALHRAVQIVEKGI